MCKDIYENISCTTLPLKSLPSIKCNTIVAKNHSATITKWGLVTLTGNLIYKTDRNYGLNKICSLNLNDIIGLPEGSMLLLKAIVSGNDSTASVIIEYTPNLDVTTYFQLKGNIANTTLQYLGIIDPWYHLNNSNNLYLENSFPTIYKINCLRIIADNRSFTITSWSIVTLDNQVIYRSDRYPRNERWILDLEDITIPKGTQFFLIANVVGKDSNSNIILEYDPNSNTTVIFELSGNSFRTFLTLVTIINQ